MKGVKIRPFEFFDRKPLVDLIVSTNIEFEDYSKGFKIKIKKYKTYNYTILNDDTIAGFCTIDIDSKRNWIGELGYFVGSEHQNKEIATEAVRQLERIGFEKLNLMKLILIIDIRNSASIKVAQKRGFEEEGILNKGHKIKEKYYDCFLFSKVGI